MIRCLHCNDLRPDATFRLEMNRRVPDSVMQRCAVPLCRSVIFTWSVVVPVFAEVLPAASLAASNDSTAGFARFESNILPILKEYCFDCHGDGMNKGKVAFDEFKTDEELLGKRELWWNVLKNLRAGIMPPERKPRPSADERRRLETW